MDLGRARSRFFARHTRRGLSFALAVVTAMSMVTAIAGPADAATGTGPARMKPIPHTDIPLHPLPVPQSPPDPPRKPASWPAAGEADVDLVQAKIDHRTADPTAPTPKQRAGALPVLLADGAGRAHVRIVDQDATRRAGVDGVLLSVTPSAGFTGVSTVGVDYRGFADAGGVGFGGRLRMVSLPACALTDPGKPECQVQSPLRSDNDPATHVVTAQVPVAQQKASSGPMVVAAVAGPGSSHGQFTASSLTPSGSWAVSGASGAFSWSYPIAVPPAATGADVAPNVGLSYSAAGVDGLTSATNNQSSAFGLGWDYTPGYVERSYRTCAEDPAQPKNQQTGDECWAGQVVTLNLGGATTALVQNDGHPDVWKRQADDGSRVERLTNAANGANGGEYWKITTTDGTQYFFGRSSDAASAWTVPVRDTQPGDPCHSDSVALASCGWRWNLDYVVDTHGNATAYYYTPETNYYGANNATTGVSYVRGGVLKRIDYGLRDTGNGIGGQTAPGQITFDTSERCDPAGKPGVDCSDPAQMTPANALAWPDVPVDQKCAATDVCNNHAPTFWSTRKTTTITTWVNPGNGPIKVDTYALGQSIPSPDYGDREVRLDSITRTGYAPDGKTSITMPPVSFAYQLMDNRVDGYRNLPGTAHWRLTNIATDTGSVITVTYSGKECTKDTVPDPATDSKLCYPVKWRPQYFQDVVLDYFHKYVTTKVEVQDRNGLSPTQVTSYAYLGTPAWHFDDNEIVKPDNRTYGQFRGYPQVEVRTGTTPDALTLTRTTYFRGMDGDTLPSGTRAASVVDSLAESVPDNNIYADQAREVQTFNGDGKPQITTTITDPVTIATTAIRARPGLSALTATISATGKTRTLTALAGGGTRTTSTSNRYNPDGRVVASTNSGDGVPDVCVSTSYAENLTAWIRGKAQEVITSQQACPPDGVTPSPILSDVRTYYDGQTDLGQVVRGDASRTDTAVNNDNGRLTFATTAQAAVDAAGRPVSATDALGHVTTTAYTPTDGGVLTQTVVTNPKNQTVTSQFEPSRGKTITEIDIAGHRTEAVYDALGRLTQIWQAGHTRGLYPASATYEYLVRTDGPLAVTSHTLVDYGSGTNYVNTVNLYDSLGQLRQTQTDAWGGGRVVNDVFYDSHGWAQETNNRYYTNGTPATTMIEVAKSAVTDRTITSYDGTGRATLATAYNGLTPTWSTRTIYGGDRTTTIPPQGGVATTTIVDARGHTTELDQYTSPPTIDETTGNVTGGAPQITKYHYTATGQQDTVTDTTNLTWTYRYDFQGRKYSQTDPDTGTSTTTYDPLGQVTSTTDARGQTLSYEYDELGRKTAEHDGPLTGPKLAEWTWDTLQAGKLTSSTRHTPGGDYVTAATGYSGMGLLAGLNVVIPDSEAGLAGSYLTKFTYTSTGLRTSDHPALAGGLPEEILRTTYDTLGKPQTLKGAFDYVTQTTYTPYGESNQFTLSTLNNVAWLTYTYDAQTRRLASQNLSAQSANDPQATDLQYSYDPAGNPTKTVESRGRTGGVRTQCYQYDPLDRLAQAWTATDNCASAPTTAQGSVNVGGPNPYWTTWSFEPGGLRTQQTHHALPGTTGGDTVTTYTYPAPTAAQPHTLTSTSTTGGPASATSTNYTYDPSGNTLTRTLPSGNQTLTWNQDNRLATVTTTAGQTTYTYDADGNQLLRHDPGKTTLYLPDEELVRDNNTGTVTGTRYYSHNGTTIAMRVDAGNPQYLLSDPHGTGEVTSDSVSRAVTRRDVDPYGVPLGPVAGGPWPDQHGFLGKPQDDATGITDIGARNYDPTTGRFLSADPVMEAGSPQQLNGYTYAGDNPTTNSDPTGLCNIDPSTDQCAPNNSWQPPPPAPGGGGTPSASKSPTLTILGANCVQRSHFVGYRNQPWHGYMITVAAIQYTAILHDPSVCGVGVGTTGPQSCQPGDFLVTWLEPEHVTATKYECGAKGSSTWVAGCNDAVASQGKQSFGEDLKDLAEGIYKLSGAKDVVDCAVGSSDNRAESCAWAAAAVVPFGVGKAAKALEVGAKAGEEGAEAATRAAVGDPAAKGGVYTLRDADDNVVRTGRTNDLDRRRAEHARTDSTADYRFQIEYRTDVYSEQRGLEQVIWMINGRPTLAGVRRISPVDVANKNYNSYMDSAGNFFNTWFPN